MTTKKYPTKKFAERYPPLYYVGTIPIRKYNVVSIYVSELNMKIVAEIAIKHEGLSVAKILSISGKPSKCCKDEMILYKHNGKNVTIPRGLLSDNRSDNGSTITKKKRTGK